MESKLDQILAKHNGGLGVTWEDPDVVTPDTKAALLSWHNKELEQAVIEARIDEISRLSQKTLQLNVFRRMGHTRRTIVHSSDIEDYKTERIAQLSKSPKPKKSTS